jgi:hypothetical protein
VTLVTVSCGPLDIATSVSEAVAAVYSPRVLRLRSQSWEHCGGRDLPDHVARTLAKQTGGQDGFYPVGDPSTKGWIAMIAKPTVP